MKLPQLVKEWLTEFKCDKDGYTTFCKKFFGNKEFYTKMITCLENKCEVESICHQFYSLGLSKVQSLNLLLFDMLPNILSFYLTLPMQLDKVKSGSGGDSVLLHTCLISIRNMLYMRYFSDEENASEIPGFIYGSIYHSTVVRPDLDIINESMNKIQLNSSVTERGDLYLLPDLIKIYNYHLTNYSEISLYAFCQLSSEIVSLKTIPRIQVSNILLLELTYGIYSILFKQDYTTFAKDALFEIESRANHELMTDAIVVICSIFNHINSNPSGQPFDCQIPINTTRHNNSSSISDLLITNANFRPEKVSEDIETVKQLTNTDNLSSSSKTEIELNDIGVNISPNKTTSNIKSKFKIKFTVGDYPVLNGDFNTSKVDNNRVIE